MINFVCIAEERNVCIYEINYRTIPTTNKLYLFQSKIFVMVFIYSLSQNVLQKKIHFTHLFF